MRLPQITTLHYFLIFANEFFQILNFAKLVFVWRGEFKLTEMDLHHSTSRKPSSHKAEGLSARL